jgi:hypothetical protein
MASSTRQVRCKARGDKGRLYILRWETGHCGFMWTHGCEAVGVAPVSGVMWAVVQPA